MLFVNGISDYTLRLDESGIYTPHPVKWIFKATNSGHSSDWEVPGPCLTSEKHTKGDRVAYIWLSEDFEQDKSNEGREFMVC